MGEKIEKLSVPMYAMNEYTREGLIADGKIPNDSDFLDITPGALQELYEIKHPERKDEFQKDEFQLYLANNHINPETYGSLVYYSWRNLLIKVPPVSDLRLLRTARNQLLITPDEQVVLFTKTLLIAGMSVGSNVVEQLIHGGIGGAYILADMDTIEITNLNRIKTGLPDVTLPKVLSSARRALELDPYLDITIMPEGINKNTLDNVCDELGIDLFIDEVDDISAKVVLRQKAQQTEKPLVMATDNSDGALIDIERYDLDCNTTMFNNRIPADILEKMISGELTREAAGAAIGKFFVGLDIVDNRLLTSLLQVRKSIPSWPQLGTAASMSGILVAFATKRILLGGNLVSDRYVASFDKDMNPDIETDTYKANREELLTQMTGPR